MDGRYCAYLRKSRADEVREKVESDYDALAHHRQTLESLAGRMGVEIERWYSDGIKSGDSLASRTEMTDLLESVRCGEWDGVLCMELERLTRGDMVDQGTVQRAFLESGALIVTPMKVYDPRSESDMDYFEFGLFMSRREFRTINRRLVAGRVASVREGQYIAQEAPYGYDKAVVDGMRTLVPNSDARFVLAAFEAFADGESYRTIAKMLDAMGARPARSQKWNPNSVVNMVHNHAYEGKIAWNATKQTVYRENGRTRTRTVANPDMMVVDGLHEAIVPPELWERCQKRIQAAPVRGAYKERNPFGRILVCDECGKALRYCDTGNAKEPMLVHLHRGEFCQTKGCSMRVLTDAVCGALSAVADDLLLPDVEGKPDARRADFERSIAEARAAIDANFDRMERNVISEDDFVRRRAVLEERIADAEAMLDALPDEESRREKAVKVRECIELLGDASVPVDVRRKALWALVDRIYYRNRAPQRHDDIELRIVMR